MPGRLITLEGLDGVGKSTQAAMLQAYCEQRGWATQVFREPGGTPLGEELRRLLKSGAAASPGAELLLFAAARAELLHELVRPALASGNCVILDRYTDSTLAYQGALQVFPEAGLEAVTSLATGGLQPDLTLLLDIDAEIALQRRSSAGTQAEAGPGHAGGLDAIEQRNLEYFERVRTRYLKLQQSEAQRIILIDARLDISQVAEAIKAAVEKKWPI